MFYFPIQMGIVIAIDKVIFLRRLGSTIHKMSREPPTEGTDEATTEGEATPVMLVPIAQSLGVSWEPSGAGAETLGREVVT